MFLGTFCVRLDARETFAFLPQRRRFAIVVFGIYGWSLFRSLSRICPAIGWLDHRQFLVAVAIGVLSPGPVVLPGFIIGYLVTAWLGERLVSSRRHLFPVLRTRLIAAMPRWVRAVDPIANVLGIIRGASAAAIGAILGAI